MIIKKGIIKLEVINLPPLSDEAKEWLEKYAELLDEKVQAQYLELFTFGRLERYYETPHTID